MKSKFSQRLRQLREEKGILQKNIAEVLNITRAAITQYENDNRFPDQEMLMKIADFYDVTLDYLLGRTDVRYINDIIPVYEFNIKDIEESIMFILDQEDITLDGETLSYESKLILESSIHNGIKLARDINQYKNK